MSNETPTLEANARDKVGTRYSARLRKAGKLPAVIYGHGEEPAHVTLDGDALTDCLHGGAHLLEIKIDGAKAENCLIKAVQYDYLGDHIIHVDLARVDLNEVVEVQVPITLKNQDNCPALKQPGAVLNQPLTDLVIACKANAIPEEVVLDITELKIGDSITAGDLTLPAGVELVADTETTVVSITVVQEEDLDAATADADASAEPEVLSEKKEDNGDGGGGDKDKD